MLLEVEKKTIATFASAAETAPGYGPGQGQAFSVSDRHRQMAHELSIKHGPVYLAVETSGVHAYMASPICLDNDGSVELMKRHLAVNLDKFFSGTDLAACCMKTGKAYRVSTLLAMTPLSMRGFNKVVPKIHYQSDPDKLEDDGKGHKIPRQPGRVVPVVALAPDHLAIQYLKYRGFTDLRPLWEQCRMSWCVEENPKSFYATIKGGYKASPQSRLVMYINQFDVQMGWQARVLEVEQNGFFYFLEPYSQQWVPVRQRTGEGQWQELLPPYDKKWDPRKYVFPAGTRRNLCVMGFDAAVAWSCQTGRRTGILMEGPLDMARFRPPAMATMGKFFSEEQARLLASHFDELVYVQDNDSAGNLAAQRVLERMQQYPTVRLRFEQLPPEFKDPGEMSDEQALEFKATKIFK